jgi:hypothetical protein
MPKRLLMGASCLLAAALVMVASAAAAKGKPHKAASRVTSALTVSVNQTTGIAKATGLVKVNGKKVPIRWHNVATRSDSWGNVCGGKVQAYTVSSFKAGHIPGIYKLKFSFRTAKKYNGRYYTRSKTVSLNNYAERSYCAALPAQPVDASSICDWGTAPVNPDPAQYYCGGSYSEAPEYLTRPQMTGSFIGNGQIGSASADCSQTDVKGKWPPPTIPWIGGTANVGFITCKDGTMMLPDTSVTFRPSSNPSISCSATGDWVTGFVVPPALAAKNGDLYVTFEFKVQASKNPVIVGKTMIENRDFQLTGSD